MNDYYATKQHALTMHRLLRYIRPAEGRYAGQWEVSPNIFSAATLDDWAAGGQLCREEREIPGGPTIVRYWLTAEQHTALAAAWRAVAARPEYQVRFAEPLEAHYLRLARETGDTTTYVPPLIAARQAVAALLSLSPPEIIGWDAEELERDGQAAAARIGWVCPATPQGYHCSPQPIPRPRVAWPRLVDQAGWESWEWPQITDLIYTRNDSAAIWRAIDTRQVRRRKAGITPLDFNGATLCATAYYKGSRSELALAHFCGKNTIAYPPPEWAAATWQAWLTRKLNRLLLAFAYQSPDREELWVELARDGCIPPLPATQPEINAWFRAWPKLDRYYLARLPEA